MLFFLINLHKKTFFNNNFLIFRCFIFQDVEAIIGAVGIEVDAERLDKLITELKGKDIEQLISEGAGE